MATEVELKRNPSSEWVATTVRVDEFTGVGWKINATGIPDQAFFSVVLPAKYFGTARNGDEIELRVTEVSKTYVGLGKVLNFWESFFRINKRINYKAFYYESEGANKVEVKGDKSPPTIIVRKGSGSPLWELMRILIGLLLSLLFINRMLGRHRETE